MSGCGKMILGSDSHTRYGALGTIAIGEGGPELVKQLLNKTYDIGYPEVVCVYLQGSPKKGIGPHDVALAIMYFCTEWKGEQDGKLQSDRLSTFLGSYRRTLRQNSVAPPLTEAELRYLPHMIRAADVLILEWVIDAPALTRQDRRSRISALRHLNRLLTWLDDESNRAVLERTAVACGQA